MLRAPNYERPFLLAVDASAYGAGTVLLQEDVKGIEHPVSYKKKIYNRHQHAYTTVGKEALDLVLAIQHFDVYLSTICGPIIVYTDQSTGFLESNVRYESKNHDVMSYFTALPPAD